MGKNSAIPKEERIKLAQSLASGKTLTQIATEHKIDYDYLRKIAKGERVRDVKKLADELVGLNAQAVVAIAKHHARGAVAKLVTMSQNKPTVAGGASPYSEDIELAASKEVIRLALADVAEVNTVHHQVEGGVVLLADVIRSQATISPERRAALGLDELIDGNGNGHALPDGNGHSGNGKGGNGHATSPDNGHG